MSEFKCYEHTWTGEIPCPHCQKDGKRLKPIKKRIDAIHRFLIEDQSIQLHPYARLPEEAKEVLKNELARLQRLLRTLTPPG